jgi:TolA-binding protein
MIFPASSVVKAKRSAPPACPPRRQAFSLAVLGVLAAMGLMSFGSRFAGAQTPKASGAGATSAAAETSPALNELYRKSIGHFAKGNYADCVAGLKEMLSQGAEGAGLESLYFTLAAASFNLKEYASASEAFKEYLSKFPRGERVAEAQLGVGQCQAALGDKKGALATFEELSGKSAAHKEKLVGMRAALLKENGQAAEALALLRPVVTGALNSEDAVQQACLIASLEASGGSTESAIKILSFLQQRLHSAENPLQINALAFEVGDALLGKKAVREALRAYALVRPKAEVVALQRAKLEAMVRRHNANLEAAKSAPSRAAELHQINATLMSAFEEGKKILEQVDQVEDFMVSLRLRQARAYQEMGRHWECVLLLENILLEKVPDSVREETLFALSTSHSELQNAADLKGVISRYQKEFPKGRNAESVDFLSGVVLLQKDDFGGAEAIFTRMVKAYPKGQKASETLFLLANTRFAAGRHAEALGAYEEYLKKFPQESFAEEARYRLALCHFFMGEYAKAHPALEAYVKEVPGSPFLADARYRIAVCYQAAGEYAGVVQRCAQWNRDFPENALQAEVHALHGDALAAQDRREDAAAAYEKAVQSNPGEQVLGYALMEANKQYQKMGRWDLSARLFREFLEKYPDHPAEITAVYWLSKSMARDGKLEEAKQMLVEKISKTIADRSRDAVEQVITQLAQLCAKRPPPPVPASAPADAAPVTEVVPPPVYDAAAEMRRQLEGIESKDLLSQARRYFAEAELARLTRKPAEAAQWLDKIADQIPASALGAALLAQMGDRLLQRREVAKARAAYEELQKAFPGSELLDYAYNGRGQLELLAGNPKEALRWFQDAVEKAGAVSKLKDVTLGRAKALLALGNGEEAKPIFEQVAGTREWRGEVTAEAVFYLGEVAFLKQDYTAAVQFFQRVFVAYQRYPSVVARAYLRAADCFEKLGEPEKALAHLREMVAREKLAGLPEVEQGRKRMEALVPK